MTMHEMLLALKRAPNSMVMLVGHQYAETWHASFESKNDVGRLELSVDGDSPELTVEALYNKVMQVTSQGAPEFAPIAIGYFTEEPQRPAAAHSALDDEIPF